ncbi:hypothetical protein SPONN_6 [uncultured Candidatus Thioglobus sp.]|nr:hypothetical protein SPONN_6 [uncultured Candidatus Thioglobus sp.]
MFSLEALESHTYQTWCITQDAESSFAAIDHNNMQLDIGN